MRRASRAGCNADAKNEFQVVPSSTARGEGRRDAVKAVRGDGGGRPGSRDGSQERRARRSAQEARGRATRGEDVVGEGRAGGTRGVEAAKELDVAKRKKRFDEEEELRVAEIGRLRKELAEADPGTERLKVAWDERDKRDEEERLAREAAAAAGRRRTRRAEEMRKLFMV